MSFSINVLAESNITVLQRVQNGALKAIFKPPFRTNLIRLGESHNVPSIKDRLDSLFTQYFVKAIQLSNPLIQQLAIEYKSAFGGRGSPNSTPLGPFYNYLIIN
jgi:hypothetical protein